MVSVFEIHEGASVHVSQFAQREMQSLSSTKRGGVQQIKAGLAGMHPDRNGIVLRPLASGERKVLPVSCGLAVCCHGEPSIGGIEFTGSRAFDERVVGEAVGDEILDGHDAQPKSVCDAH